MSPYRGTVASASQLISLKSLPRKSYWIYFPKMISIPFLPEARAPAEFIPGRQSPRAEERAGAGEKEVSGRGSGSLRETLSSSVRPCHVWVAGERVQICPPKATFLLVVRAMNRNTQGAGRWGGLTRKQDWWLGGS